MPAKNDCDGRAVEIPCGETSESILCSFKGDAIFQLKDCQNGQCREHIS